MSTEPQIPVTHVIFDFDGTIINSIDVMIDVLRDYAKSHRKELSPEIEKYIANTTSVTILFKKFIDSLELNEEINLTEIGIQLSKNFYEKEFRLIPGVDRLIKHLNKNNIPIAIATGNSKRHFDKIYQKFGNYFEDGLYFSHTVCGWDDLEVVNKKPHPDVYHVCAKRFLSPPNDNKNVLIIEDSITGIEGATASGMQTVLVKDIRIEIIDEKIDGISAIFDSFDEFKPEIFGLPAYPK